jgi:hypothetical protein
MDNSKCPECGSTHIEGGFVEICGMEAVQEMSFSQCAATWEEAYVFCGRRNVQVDGVERSIDAKEHGTLVIGNVDLGLLEEQRLSLSRAVDCAAVGQPADQKDLGLLDGLRNLLDTWSDNMNREEMHEAG